ncbi:hypothetical protein [Nocardia sp. Marseille-Q1738]
MKVIVSPKTQIIVHATLLTLFVILIPPTVLLWSESIPYIAYLSVYAIIASHWTGLVAALSWMSSQHVEENGDA